MSTTDAAERWLPYPGSPFEVSDLGRVRSWAWKRCRPIKPSPQTEGYLQVTWRREGKRHTRLVHRMVLEAFVGPCPPGMECRHLDGDRKGNRLGNLEWGTPVQNCQDTVRHGKGGNRLTKVQAGAVKLLLAAGWSQRAVARRYGVSSVAICHIAKGRSHRDVVPQGPYIS
jgi:hypothetical protein